MSGLLLLLRNILLTAACVIGLMSVGLGIYTMAKAMAAPTVDQNRYWKRRYYRWMGLFLLIWLGMLLFWRLSR